MLILGVLALSACGGGQNQRIHKKATGKITFTCNDGKLIEQTIKDAVLSGEGKTCWMKSEGVNEDGTLVSVFEFEWTLKVKSH